MGIKDSDVIVRSETVNFASVGQREPCSWRAEIVVFIGSCGLIDAGCDKSGQ